MIRFGLCFSTGKSVSIVSSNNERRRKSADRDMSRRGSLSATIDNNISRQVSTYKNLNNIIYII